MFLIRPSLLPAPGQKEGPPPTSAEGSSIRKPFEASLSNARAPSPTLRCTVSSRRRQRATHPTCRPPTDGEESRSESPGQVCGLLTDIRATPGPHRRGR